MNSTAKLIVVETRLQFRDWSVMAFGLTTASMPREGMIGS